MTDPERILTSDLDPLPRIRGIDTVDEAREWIQVEIQTDGEPRRRLIAALNQRIETLQIANACAECGSELVEQNINGVSALWCSDCGDFRREA